LDNRKEMEMEIDLREWFLVIKSKIWVLVLWSIICGVAVFFLATNYIDPKYQSHIDLYVTNTSSESSKPNGSVNVNDLNASQKLVNTYKIILQTEEATEKLRSVAELGMTNEEILGSLHFAARDNTEVLRITATTGDPFLSAKICNGYGVIAPSVLNDIVEGGSVKVLTVAKPNGVPSSPNVKLYTMAGFAFGFIAAAAFFILSDMFSNTVKGENELTDKLQLAVIGTVPDFFSLKELHIPRSVKTANKKIMSKEGSNAKHLTDYTLLRQNSPFVVSEAYNMIQTNLRFSMSTTNSNIVVITSSLPNECKSTTSVNTAISAALSGMRVLLIDGDLRNPTIHRILKKGNRKGLSRIIAGFDRVEETLQPGPQPGMDILTAGPTPPNPSTLLGSDSMGKLLSSLSKNYDLIIIDMPPINIVADVMAIAKHTSGVVLAVREGKTKYSDLSKAIAKVNTAQCELLGVVLTDSERMSSGYGDYRYGYGYGQS